MGTLSNGLNDKEQQLRNLGLQRLFVFVLDFDAIQPTDSGLNQFLVEAGVELFKRKNLDIEDRLMVVMTSAPPEKDCRQMLKMYGLEPESLELIGTSTEDSLEDLIASSIASWVLGIPGAISFWFDLPFQLHWSGIAPNSRGELDTSEFYRKDVFATLVRPCVDWGTQTDHECELHALAVAQLLCGVEAVLGNNFYDFYDSSMLESLDGFQLAAEFNSGRWYQGIDDELIELKKEAFLQILTNRRIDVIAILSEFFEGTWGLLYGLYRSIYPDFTVDISSDMERLNWQSVEDCYDGSPEILQAWRLLADGHWELNEES